MVSYIKCKGCKKSFGSYKGIAGLDYHCVKDSEDGLCEKCARNKYEGWKPRNYTKSSITGVDAQ